MSIAPEQVQAPASDAVLFRSSPVRTFAVLFVILAVTYVAAVPIAGLILGDPTAWWPTLGQAAVISGLAAGAYTVSARAALSTWIRVSAGGLELAAQGSDPILLTWPDIATVTVRRAGLRTLLDVTPTDLDTVHPLQGDGPGWPPLRDTPTGIAFTADLTHLWPTPRSLRTELARRHS